jgi:dolichol-phosphate mannosyltransferase
MAGFIALRRETFIHADHLDPIGYKIGLELLVKCHCCSIKEIPIAFNDRLHGATKLTLQEQINYLRHLKRLFEYKTGAWGRLAQFILVGATGSIVDLLSLRLLLLSLTFPIARGLAIWLAMTWNFLLNRRLAFSYARTGPILRQYVLFCIACSLGALVNWSISIALGRSPTFFAHFPLLAAAVGIVAGTGFNYLLSSGIVFRRPKPRIPISPLDPALPRRVRSVATTRILP